MSVRTTNIEGDVSVGRNVDIGGKADVKGSVEVGHNLKVKGWLDAPNVKGCNRGMFSTLERLQTADPHPLPGWFAGVWNEDAGKFLIYIVEDGAWVATEAEMEVHDLVEFATDELVNEVSIVDDLTTGGHHDVLSAEQGKGLGNRMFDAEEVVFPLEVVFTNNADNPTEYTGAAITPTLTWVSTRKGVAVTPDTVTIKQGATTIETQTPSGNTGTCNVTVNALGDTAFQAIVEAEDLTKTFETVVRMVLPCYVGFHAADADANHMKETLDKKVLNDVSGLGGTHINLTTGNYLALMVPSNMTVHMVKSSCLPVPMQAAVTDSTIIVNGVAREYKIYRSSSPINAGNMTIEVS